MKIHGYKRGKILSYDKNKRTAQIHVNGLTDGSTDGLTARIAYPVGENDRDTERELIPGNEIFVFFEDGEPECPVIAFNSSHGTGALVDIRRIRQQNIEVLARAKVLLEGPRIQLVGETSIDGGARVSGLVSSGVCPTGVFSNYLGQTLTINKGIITNIT